MTLGQRIQELRKQRGMSQESLGEALGVSRQAVSKWEGDNGIPELDTLIAMSRLFEVTLGQLLGVEEPVQQKIEPTGEGNEDQVEAVLRRYAEETSSQKENGFRHKYLPWIGAASAAALIVIIVLFAQIGALRSTVRMLRGEISSLQVNVSNSQSNLAGQIRSTIYDILAEEAELLNTFRWEIVNFDLTNQTATLRLSATMKEYRAGSRLQFCAQWRKVDESEGRTTGDWVDGPDFRSEITLPLNYRTELSIRVEDADGTIKEQVIQTPIYELHPDIFSLQAYNVTTPFAITVRSFGISTTTAKSERAYIDIVSGLPDFFWPETAVLTASVNGAEIMRETLTITPSGREDQVFSASLRDTYYDLTLKEGDTLEVVLTVTDNLGRTEQFTDSSTVNDGRLNRKPAEVPAIPAAPSQY